MGSNRRWARSSIRSTGGAVYHRIQRAVYGGEYPDEVTPYSFATRSELGRIARELGVASGRRIVDLGCGEGSAGLWVARETGASLIGVDVSSVAIARARARIPHFGCEGRADFAVEDFVATGLPAESLDGAMSIDVLWVVPDKAAALREVARILRPGARFVFATWDFAASPPGGPQVADHRPLLRDAGFATEAYERTGHWEGGLPCDGRRIGTGARGTRGGDRPGGCGRAHRPDATARYAAAGMAARLHRRTQELNHTRPCRRAPRVSFSIVSSLGVDRRIVNQRTLTAGRPCEGRYGR